MTGVITRLIWNYLLSLDNRFILYSSIEENTLKPQNMATVSAHPLIDRNGCLYRDTN